MIIRPLQNLICPLDGTALAERAKCFICAQGHSFDRAREGYVNLLAVQDKASRDPGDSKAMVAARRRVLDAEIFAPIAAALSDQVAASVIATPGGRSATILDAGCGEGYYLAHIAARLAADDDPRCVDLIGMDISKWAVRMAARRTTQAAWVVASNRRPPVPAASVDLIVCGFGFPIWPGFAACQPEGGQVLLLDPGPDHLIEMRQIIYPEVRRHDLRPPSGADDYIQVAETRWRHNARLGSQAAIADLLAMTPHAHRATEAGHAALAAHATLDVTLDVVLRVMRRIM